LYSGGQTALKLAEKLSKYGIKIIGTSFDALDLAEDRGRFSELLTELKFLSTIWNCRNG
jgi:carbamoyl-phosphate synthase large subunit